MAQKIHISTARQMLNSRDPVDITLWTRRGEIQHFSNCMSLKYDYYNGARKIKLLNSGQVRFLADSGNLEDVFAERDLTETVTKRQENKLMMDTDYIITGNVRSIKKRTKGVGDVYYQITLELTDPQSGEIKWADEKEIRKRTTKPKIGW